MSRRWWLVLTTAVVSGVILVVILSADHVGAGPSVLSHGPYGWLVAQRYLASRGATIELGDQPINQAVDSDVLVVTFPAQSSLSDEELTSIGSYLRRGGALVYAYSPSDPSHSEVAFLRWLDLGARRIGGQPPTNPLAWWRKANQVWEIVPAAEAAYRSEPVQILAPRWVPEHDDAEVLYYGEDQTPVVMTFEMGRGTVVVLPAEALANSRISGRGNADLMEAMYQRLGRSWRFDEYRHGLVSPEYQSDSSPQRAFDLLGLHLVLCYLLAFTALARRFGPAWREVRLSYGSTAAFLIGLGHLHDRLGHHTEAARLLIKRAAELDSRLDLPSDPPAGKIGRRQLLALAQEIGKRQRHPAFREVDDNGQRATD
jgi:hypothetical protein